MQRSDALAPLSRDHQTALAVALVLRRAEEATAAAARDRFAAFFAEHGDRHFVIEEDLVLPLLPEDDDQLARVREDHAALRAAAAADGALDEAGLRATGERLAAHVRFEERTLFPRVEAMLDDAALGRLGEEIARAEAAA